MAKEYRIQVRGKQRNDIDAGLMAHLVIQLGRQLAEEEAKEAARRSPEMPEERRSDTAQASEQRDGTETAA